MDRRQKKTREAIFAAFTTLLAEKSYHQISVQEIIDAADIGRTTFYAHFETKDYLLKDLCEELFGHIIDTAMGLPSGHYHCTCGSAEDSVFLHLFKHIKKNDNNICKLLSSKNNELFLEYFKNGVRLLIKQNLFAFEDRKPKGIPEDFWVNHVTATFIETLRWWIDNKMKQMPETITEYFLLLV